MEPHHVVNLGRRWYLVAWDRGREDWRTFRVDRIARPASNGVGFALRPLPLKDPAAFVQRSIKSAPSRFEARVTLHAPAEEIKTVLPTSWGSVEPIDDGSCDFRTGDDDLSWLAVRIAMLGVDFEVREPPELIDYLRALSGILGRAADRGVR